MLLYFATSDPNSVLTLEGLLLALFRRSTGCGVTRELLLLLS